MSQSEGHDWAAFERNFIKTPGVHLLGLGMTGSGKTMKGIKLAKDLLEKGKESIVWFDSAKADEILYLLSFGLPVRVLYPGGGSYECNIKITGSPVDIEYVPFGFSKTLFRDHIRTGINIVSVRPFFTEMTPYTKFIAEMFTGLINDAYRRKIKVKPFSIFMDEFSGICPSRRAGESEYHTRLANRITMALYTLRSEKIRLCAFTQAYGDLHVAIRTQFSYMVICRNPGITGNDYLSRDLDRYSPMFAKLTPERSIIVFPDRQWKDYHIWPLPVKPDGSSVEYEGYIIKDENPDDPGIVAAPGEGTTAVAVRE